MVQSLLGTMRRTVGMSLVAVVLLSPLAGISAERPVSTASGPPCCASMAEMDEMEEMPCCAALRAGGPTCDCSLRQPSPLPAPRHEVLRPTLASTDHSPPMLAARVLREAVFPVTQQTRSILLVDRTTLFSFLLC